MTLDRRVLLFVVLAATFVITDLLNEFYGKKAARFVTLVGFAMALVAFGIIQVAIEVPWAPFTLEASWTATNQASFDNVFAGSKRILFASMVAYLIAQFLDIGVFHLLKRLSHNRYLWLRATGSTVVSQLVDTIIVQVIAWVGVMPLLDIAWLCVNSYAIKLLVAIGLTPVIYAGHALLERRLGLRAVQVDEAGEVVELSA